MPAPEIIAAIGQVLVDIITAFGAIVATITSAVVAFFTWKTRYELDQLYAKTYRPNPDGTPGKMRRHPKVMVKLFSRNNHHAKSDSPDQKA